MRAVTEVKLIKPRETNQDVDKPSEGTKPALVMKQQASSHRTSRGREHSAHRKRGEESREISGNRLVVPTQGLAVINNCGNCYQRSRIGS